MSEFFQIADRFRLPMKSEIYQHILNVSNSFHSVFCQITMKKFQIHTKMQILNYTIQMLYDFKFPEISRLIHITIEYFFLDIFNDRYPVCKIGLVSVWQILKYIYISTNN